MTSRVLLQVLSEKIKIEEIRKRFQDCIENQSKTLILDSLNLTVFPESFVSDIKLGKLSNLQLLSFNKNNLKLLPSELRHLKNLEELNAENNQIPSLPPSIGELSNLQRFHFHSNCLQSLPSEIGSLTSLTRLFLEDNQLQSLPPEIGELRNLVWLSLNNNNISYLPPEIGRLSRLGWLSIEKNKLESLPPEIGNLTNLQSLSVYDNPLSIIPRNLILLSQLQDLRANSLVRLPKELFTLSDSVKAKEIVDFLTLVIKHFNLRLDTKGHWERDGNVVHCTKCSETFTIIFRRHHCRLCGRIFCKKCCWMFLDIPVMNSVRVCDLCGKQLLNIAATPVEFQITSRLQAEYGLNEDDEGLTDAQKKQKLTNQLNQIKKALHEASFINQKDLITLDSDLLCYGELSKADQHLALQRHLEGLALVQMRIQQDLEILERRPLMTIPSSPVGTSSISVSVPSSQVASPSPSVATPVPQTPPPTRGVEGQLHRESSLSRRRGCFPPQPSFLRPASQNNNNNNNGNNNNNNNDVVTEFAEDTDDCNDDDLDELYPPDDNPLVQQPSSSSSSASSSVSSSVSNSFASSSSFTSPNLTSLPLMKPSPSLTADNLTPPSPQPAKLALSKHFQGSGSLRLPNQKHRLEIGSRPVKDSLD